MGQLITARAARRAMLLGCSALVMVAGASAAWAQDAEVPATLGEIVVTAQKREQSIQDVPISISAVGQETLQANRITNVGELAAISPGLTARPAAGGSNIPSFSMRGVTSYGVVPGSDKSVSLYIDGVYIGSATGSIFDLPDVERIEVLRGPQGTLFGRNATAGAISIITRNPTGEFGLRQELTYGNYDEFRTRTRIDTPQWGPFSGSINYLYEERRGETKNLGAGTVWDRGTNSAISRQGVQVSPKWLGNKRLEQWFAAVRFDPTDNFSTVYKFDHSVNHDTPTAQAPIAIDPTSPLIGPFLQALTSSQPGGVVFAPDGKRPDAVNNSWATRSYQKVFGHNITSTLRVNDNWSVKNILAYRESFNYGNSPIDGMSGLRLTAQALPSYAAFATLSNPAVQAGLRSGAITQAMLPTLIGQTAQALAPLVGQPFAVVGSQSQSVAKQWSEELQVNYDSKFVTLTMGAMYFHLMTSAGAPPGLISTANFTPIPGGIIPAGRATAFNWAESLAGYAQAEFHVTEQIDLVAGYRLTQDDKRGDYLTTLNGAPITSSFTYKKTKPAYTAGVNYRPTSDILVYGKYASAFVSGGSVGPAAFQPESAHSWEGGVKADLLDNRLRTNLAVWKVKYFNLQSAQAGTNAGFPAFSTVVIDNGDAKAHGFEFEATALPMMGLTLNLGVGYTDGHFLGQNPVLGPVTNDFTLQPKWTTNIVAQYETEPLFDDARLVLRTDANWRAKMLTSPSAVLAPVFDAAQYSPAGWIWNARVALTNIKVGNRGEVEVALWGRNLTDNKRTTFPLGFQNPAFMYSATFERARTYGIDINFDY